MFQSAFIIVFFAFFQRSINGDNGYFRFKRQLPNCSDGSPAVAGCFRPQLTCGKGYQCETRTGLCCKQNLPTCPSGIQASAGCINGGCNLGLRCFVTGIQPLCCRVCPNNATSNGPCSSNEQCAASNSQCNLFGGTQGLCCPSISTQSVTSTSRTPSTKATLPICPSGIQATAACINGGCNLGLRCFSAGTQSLCCRVCPNNATSTGVCTSNADCSTSNSACNLFGGTQGLCCPSPSTASSSTSPKPLSTTSRMTSKSISTRMISKTNIVVSSPSSARPTKASSSTAKRSTSQPTRTVQSTRTSRAVVGKQSG